MSNMDPANRNMNGLGSDGDLTHEQKTQQLLEMRAQTLGDAQRVAAQFRQAGVITDSRIIRTLFDKDDLAATEEVDGWFIGWADLDVAALSNEELQTGKYPGLLLAEDGSIVHLAAIELTAGEDGAPANVFHVRSYSILGPDPAKDTDKIVLLRPDEAQDTDIFTEREYDPLEAEAKIQEAVQFLESLMLHE